MGYTASAAAHREAAAGFHFRSDSSPPPPAEAAVTSMDAARLKSWARLIRFSATNTSASVSSALVFFSASALAPSLLLTLPTFDGVGRQACGDVNHCRERGPEKEEADAEGIEGRISSTPADVWQKALPTESKSM